ncbi:MAG: hypothetical protein HQK89_18020 [Nitrospirae bacterium]|nr:hypothetical protein [Nitrospirota bacterium]MBF0567125.1 hypothetical protein [Nitrospirota bacterium]
MTERGMTGRGAASIYLLVIPALYQVAVKRVKDRQKINTKDTKITKNTKKDYAILYFFVPFVPLFVLFVLIFCPLLF